MRQDNRADNKAENKADNRANDNRNFKAGRAFVWGFVSSYIMMTCVSCSLSANAVSLKFERGSNGGNYDSMLYLSMGLIRGAIDSIVSYCDHQEEYAISDSVCVQAVTFFVSKSICDSLYKPRYKPSNSRH